MSNIHLLVLIHGMWGNPAHLAEMDRIACETYPAAGSDGIVLHVLKAESIRDNSTYDGVDWGGERIAKEVKDTVKDLEREGDHVVHFSVTGYSLGGLVARYLIGVLYHAGFFKDIIPVNFNTIATPHAGLPRYPSLFSSVSSVLGPKLLSRTGEQFYCADKWSPNGRPLLVVMADPDQIFHQSLSKFQHIRIYANAINDNTVPFITAAIELSDPFFDQEASGIQIDMDEQYPCLIRKYTVPSTPPPKRPPPAILSEDWFRRLPRPILPPILQLRFPFNLVMYTFLPVLMPVFISLAILRLSAATRSSRARIKLLEKEAHTAGQQKLANILAELEREVEEAVVDLIDDPDPSSPIYLSSSQESSCKHPIISANHKKIVNWLNLIPINKEIAYFPAVRNSHAMIVCRDVKRFELHRKGEDVLKHWAKCFIL